MMRSLRLWVLLVKLYGTENPWLETLPLPFTYAHLRDRLFAPTHPTSELLSAEATLDVCNNPACLCHQSFASLAFEALGNQSRADWEQEVLHLTGFSIADLRDRLHQQPFATVHRSLRDDLKHLAARGWLRSLKSGRYQPVDRFPEPDWLQPSQTGDVITSLSTEQTWTVLRVLESVAFVEPELNVVIDSLWQQVGANTSYQRQSEPKRRVFLHVDYILSPEDQDRVDNYQEQLEQLWQQGEGGVIEFEYWSVKQERKKRVRVYPVCLHYVRRAKYLSACGIDSEGNLAWHNYRLDRIIGDRVIVLAWGDRKVPKALKQLRQSGELPTPEDIEAQLQQAWGFDFYRPRQLLIMRFPRSFARWYVDNTTRHETFQPIQYQALSELIERGVEDEQEKQELNEIISQLSPKDAYYQAWIRVGDINVLMRLRDWRPNGEVIAPLSLRHQLAAEAAQELAHYQQEERLFHE
jgi:CRISPR-associated protein (TIGR03985 family)